MLPSWICGVTHWYRLRMANERQQKKWADKLGLFYTPTLIFFDDDGDEILRVDSVVQFYRLRNVLDYVITGAYLEYPTFQQWRSAARALTAGQLELDTAITPIGFGRISGHPAGDTGRTLPRPADAAVCPALQDISQYWSPAPTTAPSLKEMPCVWHAGQYVRQPAVPSRYHPVFVP